MSNENFVFGSDQTLQITTGNVATVNDPFVATGTISAGSAILANGARNPLGIAAYISDGSTTGRRWKVRYVRVNSTTFNPSPVVGPVYWKDNTFQVVTTLFSEALDTNAAAGIMLNSSITNGNYGFILVGGFLGAANLGSIPVVALTAAGDALIGATGQQTFARVAAGTAPTNAVIAWAVTAVSGGKSDVFVTLES